MTQYSFFWDCGATGDQGFVTLEKMLWANMLLSGGSPESSGVIYWKSGQTPPSFDTGVTFSGAVDGLLEITDEGSSVVRVASGVGLVNGSIYFNDANVDFDIAADLGNANATDLIVLEKDVSASTVRLARIKGAASTKATVTQNSSVWQVALAELSLDGTGDLSSVKDVREIASTGRMIKIGELISDGSEDEFLVTVPSLFRDLRLTFDGRIDHTRGTPISTVGLTVNGDTTSSKYNNIVGSLADSNSLASDQADLLSGIQLPSTLTEDAPANYSSGFTVDIPNYRSPFYKNFISRGGLMYGALDSEILATINYGTWEDTSPITSIKLDIMVGGTGNNTFKAGTKISVYGVA